MRIGLGVGVVLALLVAAGVTGRADEQAEGVKLADAAIQAAGGEAAVGKLKTAGLKGKGTFTEGGQEASFTFDASLQGLDRVRMELEVNLGGMAQTLLLVVNGDKGWAKTPDKVEEAPAEIFPLIKGELYALRIVQMAAALKDKAVKLSPLGEVKVNDRAALGLKVVQKGRPDLDLYFDKETHLPVKCELRLKEPEKAQDVTHEWFFSDYKVAGGVKHPMKVVLQRDGQKTFELELNEVKPDEKLEENAFNKPE